MPVNSLAVMTAKKALGNIPNYNKRYKVIPYINRNGLLINLPNNYVRYAQEKVNNKLISNFMRNLSSSNVIYHGKGQLNRNMPGVYRNKKWKYFYVKTLYDPKNNLYHDKVLFYNNRNGNPVFIDPITGVRKNVNLENYETFMGNTSIPNFYAGLKKRKYYNKWTTFKKKASRYINTVAKKRAHNN